MNNTMLVGRLTTTPQLEYTETNQKYTKITLAITRPYKNTEGAYDTDFIPVFIYNEMANSVVEYTERGDLIGVKGRLETRITTDDDYNKTKEMIVVADRITFLSASHNNTTEDTTPQTNQTTNTQINDTNLNEGEI